METVTVAFVDAFHAVNTYVLSFKTCFIQFLLCLLGKRKHFQGTYPICESNSLTFPSLVINLFHFCPIISHIYKKK